MMQGGEGGAERGKSFQLLFFFLLLCPNVPTREREGEEGEGPTKHGKEDFIPRRGIAQLIWVGSLLLSAFKKAEECELFLSFLLLIYARRLAEPAAGTRTPNAYLTIKEKSSISTDFGRLYYRVQSKTYSSNAILRRTLLLNFLVGLSLSLFPIAQCSVALLTISVRRRRRRRQRLTNMRFNGYEHEKGGGKGCHAAYLPGPPALCSRFLPGIIPIIMGIVMIFRSLKREGSESGKKKKHRQLHALLCTMKTIRI